MNSGRGSSATAVSALVRDGQFDEALAELYAAAERDPDDRSVRDAIDDVRARMADAILGELGALDDVPRLTGTPDPTRASLGPDERYLLSRIDGTHTLGDLVRLSTLGRHRTVRVLSWLVKRGLVHVPPSTSRRPIAAAPLTIERVLVGDANATSASLVRTMLRVSVGRGVQFESASTGSALVALATTQPPDLLVVDFQLPGHGDGIETVRALRNTAAAHVPAIILVQKLELDYALARLPPAAHALARPLEREALEAVIDRLVPGRARTGGQRAG